jgi:hypothetical protein
MSVRVAALDDRNPSFPSHREADAAIALAPAEVDIAWMLATLLQPQMGSSTAAELDPILTAFLDAGAERSRAA